MVAHADTRVVHRGGSKINFRAPVITQDSRYVFFLYRVNSTITKVIVCVMYAVV